MSTRKRGPVQVVELNRRFKNSAGGSRVIETEIRLGQTEKKPQGYRYARMLCDCGTKYLAQISHLFHGRSWTCPGCACADQGRRRRKTGGHVYPSGHGRGYSVFVYVGHYMSRAEADDVARRARPVILPKVPPKAL